MIFYKEMNMKKNSDQNKCIEDSTCDYFFISTCKNQFLFIPINQDDIKKIKYLSDSYSLITNKKFNNILNESDNILKTRRA